MCECTEREQGLGYCNKNNNLLSFQGHTDYSITASQQFHFGALWGSMALQW